MARAARLAGTERGTACGTDVRAPEKGDGAVTAAGRGGNDAGSLTVTGARLGEVGGAGQFSASTARWDGGYAERTNGFGKARSNTAAQQPAPTGCLYILTSSRTGVGIHTPKISPRCARAALTFTLPCPTDVSLLKNTW